MRVRGNCRRQMSTQERRLGGRSNRAVGGDGRTQVGSVRAHWGVASTWPIASLFARTTVPAVHSQQPAHPTGCRLIAAVVSIGAIASNGQGVTNSGTSGRHNSACWQLVAVAAGMTGTNPTQLSNGRTSRSSSIVKCRKQVTVHHSIEPRSLFRSTRQHGRIPPGVRSASRWL